MNASDHRGHYQHAREQIARIRGAMRSALAAPSNRYLDEFVALKCSGDMCARKVFPNAKEITESFGAYNAARKYLRDVTRLSDPSVLCVAVGDGHGPRTGATFAFRSVWHCVSVDPLMDPRWTAPHGIDRLECLRAKAEDVSLSCEQAVIVAVHSHAPLDAAIRCVRPRSGVVHVIAIPCCVEQWIEGHDPDCCYTDVAIHSPQCTVLVWRNVDVPMG